MTSIFVGQKGLRLKYHDLAFSDLAAAVDASTAVLLHTVQADRKLALLDNSMDAFCVILVCHPEADSSVIANRLVLMELACPRQINLDLMGTGNFEVDPGTKIFVFRDPLCSPTCGKVRLISWG